MQSKDLFDTSLWPALRTGGCCFRRHDDAILHAANESKMWRTQTEFYIFRYRSCVPFSDMHVVGINEYPFVSDVALGFTSEQTARTTAHAFIPSRSFVRTRHAFSGRLAHTSIFPCNFQLQKTEKFKGVRSPPSPRIILHSHSIFSSL